MSSDDAQTERDHLQREQDDFLRGVKRQCANLEPHGPHVWGRNQACLGVSAHPDRATGKDVIYAWQMDNNGTWNIIGMGIPGSNAVLPMITAELQIAWMGFEVAQAHANRHNCQVRLASFAYADLLSVVLPQQETADE